MGTTVHVYMLNGMCESPERPPDHPHMDMMEEAIRSGAGILTAAGIPYRLDLDDRRDGPDPERNFASFTASIEPLGPGEGCGHITYGWDYAPLSHEYKIPGEEIWRPVPEDGTRPPSVISIRAASWGWRGWQHTKTEYAKNFHLTHAAVCRVYEEWLDRELISKIEDEGEWYPSHSIKTFEALTGKADQSAMRYLWNISQQSEAAVVKMVDISPRPLPTTPVTRPEPRPRRFPNSSGSYPQVSHPETPSGSGSGRNARTGLGLPPSTPSRRCAASAGPSCHETLDQ